MHDCSLLKHSRPIYFENHPSEHIISTSHLGAAHQFHAGVSVHGAKYGIDMRETGDSATYVTITLINQTCAGAIMDSASSMTATGMRVEGSPKLAGILAGVNPNGGHGADKESPCALAPLAPGAAKSADAKQQLRVDGPGNWGGSPASVLRSAVSIVDSSVALVGVSGSDVPCVLAEGSLYISDTYLSGCDSAVVPSGRAPLPAVGDGSQHTHVALLSMGRKGYNNTSPYLLRQTVASHSAPNLCMRSESCLDEQVHICPANLRRW